MSHRGGPPGSSHHPYAAPPPGQNPYAAPPGRAALPPQSSLPHGGGPPPGAGRGRGGPPPGIATGPTVALAHRPPQAGRGGRPIQVVTNCFEVEWKAPPALYHYDIRISPPYLGSASVLANTRCVNQMMLYNTDIFPTRGAYDGKYNLYVPNALRQDFTRVPVLMREGRQGEAPPQAGEKGHPFVELTLVGVVDPKKLTQYVTSGAPPSSNEVLQILNCLNVIIRQAPYQAHPHNARAFFPSRDTRPLSGGLLLVRGYFQSVRPARARLLINIDITTGLQWADGPLFSTVHALLMLLRNPQQSGRAGQPNARDLVGMHEREVRVLRSWLKGVRVRPNHRRDAKDRGISGFDVRGADGYPLEEGDPRSLTVAQYLQQTYGYTVRYPKIPLAVLGRGVALPLEVLDILPGQLTSRRPTPSQMKDVLQFSTKRPNERLQAIRDGVTYMAYGQSDWMRQVGMRVGGEAIGVNGRVVQGPPVVYQGRGRDDEMQIRDGAWNARGKVFYRPPTFTKWAIAWFNQRGDSRDMDQNEKRVREGLVRAMGNVGINLSGSTTPRSYVVQNFGQLEGELTRIGHDIVQRFGSGPPELIVCIMDGSTALYTGIKHWGDCLAGVATQCLRIDKVIKANDQYWGNVVMKICLKMKGLTHVIPPHPWLLKSPTMVMGADTAHPAPGQTDQPTISAVVGSVDKDATRYNSIVKVQKGRQEVIADLAEMVAHHVRQFERHQRKTYNTFHTYPRRILFYRDGVSEGQFAEIVTQEVEAIRQGYTIIRRELNQLYDAHVEECKKKGTKPPQPPALGVPKITFIVVGKRHHIRFFPKNKNDEDRSGNAPAGLIVDTEIVHPYEWDFYLQSHAGLLGTSRPMHTSVLIDENNMTADDLEEITFGLTHNFGRSTRTVSIPTPVYHADIACSRAKIHFERDVEYGEEADGRNSDDASLGLQYYQSKFKNIHPLLADRMYWM